MFFSNKQSLKTIELLLLNTGPFFACAFVPLYGIDISFQSTTLSGSQSSSFSQLKSCLSSWGFSHWERFWKAHTLEMVKYNSIQKY